MTAVVVYGAFWLALAAWIDARSRDATTTQAVLASVWLAAVVVVPGLVHATAMTLFPVGSRTALEETVREVQQQVWSQSQADVLSAFFSEHPEADREGIGSLERFMSYQMRLVDEAEARVAPLRMISRSQQQAQRRFVRLSRFASPASLMEWTLYELAGAGEGRRAHYQGQVETFISEWRAYFVPKIYARTPIRRMADTPVFVCHEGAWTWFGASASMWHSSGWPRPCWPPARFAPIEP